MRLILFVLFLALPYFSFAQGQGKPKKFKIKIGLTEYLTDVLPSELDQLPQRVNKIWIKEEKEKKDKDKDKDEPPLTYTMLVGEEERVFLTDGEYHEMKFTHDIKGMLIYILDEKRAIHGKPFTLKKRK
jgi:hypothetical protein